MNIEMTVKITPALRLIYSAAGWRTQHLRTESLTPPDKSHSNTQRYLIPNLGDNLDTGTV